MICVDVRLVNNADVPLSQNDLDIVIGWLNDQHLMKYSQWCGKVHTRESQMEYVRSFRGSPNHYFGLYEYGRLVGTVTVMKTSEDEADIGLLIGEPGRGYGTAALKAIFSWGLYGRRYRKLTAGCMADHRAMRHICEKVGMQLEQQGDVWRYGMTEVICRTL